MDAKDNNQPITVAVIGYGFIGKRHAEIIATSQAFCLAAIVDTDSTQREAAITRYPTIPVFDSIEALVHAKIPVTLSSICTPNGNHFQAGIIALTQLKSHVLIEKPLCLKSDNGRKLIQTAAQFGKYLFCMLQNRYSPVVMWLKNLVDAGQLGQIYQVSVECYWNRDARYYLLGSWRGTTELDGGVLFTQFSHFLDLVYWLFGKPTINYAHLYNFSHKVTTAFEDSGLVAGTIANHALFSLNFSTAVVEKNLTSRMTILAERAAITLGGQYMNKLEAAQFSHIPVELPTMPDPPPNRYGTYEGSAANHPLVYNNIAEVLLHDAKPLTTGQDGLAVVEIIEAIHRFRT